MDGHEDDRLVLADAHVVGYLRALLEPEIGVVVAGEEDLLVRILPLQEHEQLLGHVQDHVLFQQAQLPVVADRPGVLAPVARVDQDGRHPGGKPPQCPQLEVAVESLEGFGGKEQIPVRTHDSLGADLLPVVHHHPGRTHREDDPVSRVSDSLSAEIQIAGLGFRIPLKGRLELIQNGEKRGGLGCRTGCREHQNEQHKSEDRSAYLHVNHFPTSCFGLHAGSHKLSIT